MKKGLCFLAALVMSVGILTGCSADIVDGTYRAEFKEYDTLGWKDYVVLTVENGEVTAIEADAINENGDLKSLNTDYKDSMESTMGTYPEKYYSDLVNQYIAGGDIDNVDIVAGATLSSENFKVLVTALSSSMQSGNTDTVLVDYPAATK